MFGNSQKELQLNWKTIPCSKYSSQEAKEDEFWIPVDYLLVPSSDCTYKVCGWGEVEQAWIWPAFQFNPYPLHGKSLSQFQGIVVLEPKCPLLIDLPGDCYVGVSRAICASTVPTLAPFGLVVPLLSTRCFQRGLLGSMQEGQALREDPWLPVIFWLLVPSLHVPILLQKFLPSPRLPGCQQF